MENHETIVSIMNDDDREIIDEAMEAAGVSKKDKLAEKVKDKIKGKEKSKDKEKSKKDKSKEK